MSFEGNTWKNWLFDPLQLIVKPDPGKPELPVSPTVPSAAAETAKRAKEYARRRASNQQGIEDTMLTGSTGIAVPGLKTVLG